MLHIRLVISLMLYSWLSSAQATQLIAEITSEKSEELKLWNIESCCSYSVQISDSIAYKGTKSLRFELRKTDSIVYSGKRAEIRSYPEKTSNRWYRFSNYLPNTYCKDSDFEILAQWHNVPDFDLGETHRSPPISLSTENGHWYITILWATDSVNTNKTITGKKIVDLGPYRYGKWTDWLFHINFSYQSDGVLEVWKNGKLKYSQYGPNSYNDKKYPFFKFGIYKPLWNRPDSNKVTTITKRVIYYDDIKIGSTKSSVK